MKWIEDTLLFKEKHVAVRTWAFEKVTHSINSKKRPAPSPSFIVRNFFKTPCLIATATNR